MCVYIYIYICMCVYMCVYIYMYTHTQLFISPLKGKRACKLEVDSNSLFS